MGEGAAILGSSLIASVSNPSGDSITQYNFYDFGGAGGYFTVNGLAQPDDQWILVPASNLSGVAYIGGPAPGSETLAVSVYDGTAESYSNYSSLTAAATAPLGPSGIPPLGVQDVSLGASAAIAASSLITSVSNRSGDSITQYNFYDWGVAGGYVTVNGVPQPDRRWILVPASNLSSVAYVGGTSSTETLSVSVYDGTTDSYSSFSTLTATATAPLRRRR